MPRQTYRFTRPSSAGGSLRRVAFRSAKGIVAFRSAKGHSFPERKPTFLGSYSRPNPNAAWPQPKDRGTEPPPTATRRISTWPCTSRLRPAIPICAHRLEIARSMDPRAEPSVPSTLTAEKRHRVWSPIQDVASPRSPRVEQPLPDESRPTGLQPPAGRARGHRPVRSAAFDPG